MPYEPFSQEGSSTSGSSEGRFTKVAPFFSFFFFLIIFFFFPLGPFLGGGAGRGWGSGGRGIVVLPGWLPLQGNYQAILLFNGR